MLPNSPTSKPSPRWVARVKFYERPQPAHAPFSAFWMSDHLKAESSSRPASREGVRFIYPDPKNEERFDGNPGEPRHLKAAALTLDYAIQWLPTRLGGAFGWVRLSTPQEAAFRAIDRATAQNEMERLKEELEEKPNDDNLKEQLLEAETTYHQLGDGKEGYCRTGEWMLDTKTSGLFWGLNAPNVPVRFVSSFVLPEDGSFSTRVKRDKMPVGQVNGTFAITVFNDAGKKSTCYRLLIGDDGNASRFQHYRNMPRREREALQSELDELENLGRETAFDKAQLALWKEEQEAIKRKAKTEGRKELSREESAQIELLDAQARSLKESKKNTAGEKERIAAIKKALFIEERDFALVEDAQNMLGKTLDITWQFLRSGNVVIRCNESEFIYINERAQDAAARRRYGNFTTQLPDKSRIQIDSNGGMWGLVFGRPQFQSSGVVLSQPIELPEGAALDDVEYSYEGDAPHDTDVRMELVPHPKPRGRALYQLKITLLSQSRRFTPEIYRADVHLKAGETPEYSESVWDSQNPGNPIAASGNSIIDVVLEAERARSVQAKITVPQREIPANVAALAADVRLYDRWEEKGDAAFETSMVKMGRISVNEVDGARRLDTEGLELLHGALAEVAVVGPENWLDAEIKAPFVCDGMRVGEALRALCRDAGMPPSLYANIEVENTPLIESSVPGKWPKWLPGVGVKFLEFSQQLVKANASGWQWYSDREGLRFTRWAMRDKRSRHYDHASVVGVHSLYCLRGESKIVQDVADYRTSVTVIGDINPLAGQRYSATESIPLAEDPQFADSSYYIGEVRHETRNEGDLGSETACLMVAREALGITPLTPDGLSPWQHRGTVLFDPDFMVGDVVTLCGTRALMDSIRFGSLNAEEDRQKINFTAIYAGEVVFE